jgi:hypothetical protein
MQTGERFAFCFDVFYNNSVWKYQHKGFIRASALPAQWSFLAAQK